MKQDSGSSKKINKIDKFLGRMTKNLHKKQKNEIGNLTTYFAATRKTIRKYYQQLYTQKFNNFVD